MNAATNNAAAAAIQVCTPVIASAAIFIAILVLDLYQKEYEYVLGHVIWGLIATLLINILCDKGMGFAAWALLFFPIVIILLGILYVKIEEQRKARAIQTAIDKLSPPAKAYNCKDAMDPM
jgi:membrane-anchored protein YejM (alkaline phosphatase superfamily)